MCLLYFLAVNFIPGMINAGLENFDQIVKILLAINDTELLLEILMAM